MFTKERRRQQRRKEEEEEDEEEEEEELPIIHPSENNMAVGFVMMTVGQGDVEAFDSQCTSIEEKMPGIGRRWVADWCCSAVQVVRSRLATH
jgi:hypothetical protein